MERKSFLWHDYETYGINPSLDRPSQFACIRTDSNLNEVDEPLVIYCKPANDFLPSPEACLITGITPQIADERGLIEADFFNVIRQQMMVPNTCSVGYNSIKFDDEVTRIGFYRNLHDSYEREYKNNNSRWDLINVMRMIHALRPENFNWPTDDNGKPTFKLESLTKENGIPHAGAHDALSDVRATIGLARLIKEREPALFDYMLNNRHKAEAAQLLKIGMPILHADGSHSNGKNCLAIVLPIAKHPTNANGVIVYDLSVDPQQLLDMSADEIKATLYKKSSELPEDFVRIPLKLVQINKCPALAPLATLRKRDLENSRPSDIARLGIDIDLLRNNSRRITSDAAVFAALQAKISAVFKDEFKAEKDPDLMLYSGGFLSNDDKNRLLSAKKLTPNLLATTLFEFSDDRLPELLFRYRARNYLESLSVDEKSRWDTYRFQRIEQYTPNYIKKIDDLIIDQLLSGGVDACKKAFILDQLKNYALAVFEPCFNAEPTCNTPST